jgi:hypothetical protein
MADPIPPADLHYSIARGLLYGTAGGKDFSIPAWSGFGGGSTRHAGPGKVLQYMGPVLTWVPTSDEGKKHQHGGPLPVGTYTIERPARNGHLGQSAKLDPAEGNWMLGRSDFFIHGRGPHGSDGCIVPSDKFQDLMDALTDSGGGTLVVENF